MSPGDAEQVLVDEHLAVAAASGADADGDDVELLGDEGRQGRRDAFEHHREGARLLHLVCVLNDTLGGVGVFALHLEAPKGVDRLRGHADVALNRNARVDDGLDLRGDRGAALELDRLRMSLLDQPAGVGQGVVLRGLVGEKGHVGDQKRVGERPAHGGGVVNHVLHGHRQGVGVAEHGHSQRVAHQDGVDAGLLDQARHGVIVGGHHRDLLARALLLLHAENGVLGHRNDPFSGRACHMQ